VAYERTVLTDPRRGLVSLRNLVSSQEFGQDLGVEPIGLLDRFGDDPELVGIGQYDPLGQGLDQVDQPLIAGGGLDGGLERSEIFEELGDRFRLTALESPPSQDSEFFVHDADRDSLLVEVDADVLHDRVSRLGADGRIGNTLLVFPTLRVSAGRRVDFLPLIASNSTTMPSSYKMEGRLELRRILALIAGLTVVKNI